MREIKFRAWHRKHKEWHRFIIPFDLFKTKFVSDGSLIEPNPLDYGHWCEYTGLKDRNGKEIYEGDVVRVNKRECGTTENETEDMAVEWYGFGWSPWVIEDCYIDGDFKYSDKPEHNEVIGNIYENPELAG